MSFTIFMPFKKATHHHQAAPGVDGSTKGGFSKTVSHRALLNMPIFFYQSPNGELNPNGLRKHAAAWAPIRKYINISTWTYVKPRCKLHCIHRIKLRFNFFIRINQGESTTHTSSPYITSLKYRGAVKIVLAPN